MAVEFKQAEGCTKTQNQLIVTRPRRCEVLRRMIACRGRSILAPKQIPQEL